MNVRARRMVVDFNNTMNEIVEIFGGMFSLILGLAAILGAMIVSIILLFHPLIVFEHHNCVFCPPDFVSIGLWVIILGVFIANIVIKIKHPNILTMTESEEFEEWWKEVISHSHKIQINHLLDVENPDREVFKKGIDPEGYLDDLYWKSIGE